jgi:hypothetical protein
MALENENLSATLAMMNNLADRGIECIGGGTGTNPNILRTLQNALLSGKDVCVNLDRNGL